jgi:hypothetical protein
LHQCNHQGELSAMVGRTGCTTVTLLYVLVLV